MQRILAIRDEPPENLRRVPGPKTILYYLHKDEHLKEQKLYLHQHSLAILKQHQRIPRRERREHRLMERPAPMSI